MRVVFTKSKNPVSFLIRHLTNEPVSHVAFVFDEKLVIHMNFLGFHVEWLKDFLKKCQIVESVERDLTTSQEELIYQKLIQLDRASYDFGALLFYGFRLWLFRKFKTPLPAKNKWGKRDKLWCVELAEGLRGELGLPPQLKFDMVTPHQFYLVLAKKYRLKNNTREGF